MGQGTDALDTATTLWTSEEVLCPIPENPTIGAARLRPARFGSTSFFHKSLGARDLRRRRRPAPAESRLKAQLRDHQDDEIARLKSKLGDLMMDNELLQEKIERLEARAYPLARWRSK